jgi:beta-glucanase (GH16 family)
MKSVVLGAALSVLVSFTAGQISADTEQENAAGPPGSGWQLVFEEQFDGANADLDARWQFQNGPSGHILSSRWRDNTRLEDGILKMIARKEHRAGQDWTAANLWTKQQFKYGYFECRYRYAPATGTNNSFWLMSHKPSSEPGRFEIDINEGHYPCEVNMNLHQHSGKHWAKGGRWYYYGSGPDGSQDDAGFQFILEKPLLASKLRLVSRDADIVRVMELRAFPPSDQGYPSVFPNPKEAQPNVPNLAAEATVEASSQRSPTLGPEKAIDGELSTESRWVSAKNGSPRVLTLSFDRPREIGCLQFISGWLDGGKWRGIVQDFHFEYWDGKAWQPVPGAESADLVESQRDPNAPPDLGHSFHVYGLEWNEEELIYYFDGQEIRRMGNEICHGESPVRLSLAIIRWAGAVTDAIDGTSMDVDWVRVWQRRR